MLVGTKKCQCCGHSIKVYRYFLDDLDVSSLLKIWQAVIEQGINEIKVNSLDMTDAMRHRTTQLRFFGLLQKVRNEKGQHKSGYWLITKRGGDFLHGRITVPYYAWTINNRVIEREKLLIELKNLKKCPNLNEIKRYAHRADYRLLKDFQPAYDIVGNRPIKIELKQLQPSMAF